MGGKGLFISLKPLFLMEGGRKEFIGFYRFFWRGWVYLYVMSVYNFFFTALSIFLRHTHILQLIFMCANMYYTRFSNMIKKCVKRERIFLVGGVR